MIGALAASTADPPGANALDQMPAAIVGTWTGTVSQNKGKSNYTVVMTVSASGATTEYPELKCGGALTRVGQSRGYVFFTETISHGGQGTGGSCIDGTITVAPADGKLAWGWIGSFKGETYVAWSTATRK